MTYALLVRYLYAVVSGITFTQQPVNSNVLLGEVVACCCEYTGVNTLPYWNLSGVLFPASEVPPHYTVNSTGLFFIATPEVNNTYYQCLFGSEAAAASSIGRVLITQDPGKYVNRESVTLVIIIRYILINFQVMMKPKHHATAVHISLE